MVKSTRTEYLPIQLRALQIEDFPVVVKWSKDHAFCLANGWETGRNEDELFSWWHNCVHNHSHNFLRLGIEFESRLIGYADLANINSISSEISIAIGESRAWGHGVGTNALKQLIVYATVKFRTQVFDAETHETNMRSRKMLKKLGFTEISRIGSEEYMGKGTQLIQYRYNKGE
ncbi:GNAT family N-acetyltransferase [Sutcliffiella horikoshii]|uniref:GNAT family N-acetyltransferase n=1 Tax=Sutcliffiella horikoshii TaxID=79883 RepID=A0AA94WMK8_9BACI|nr:GNAT family N-acetyltransferase [Sutcliffiella horikoshii]TYS54428.1 GNAT family N-acetyltransferase [Sutcliffiella horikoshii]